ncbi:MAG: YdcF family protein [Acidobacteriota bacterium]
MDSAVSARDGRAARLLGRRVALAALLLAFLLTIWLVTALGRVLHHEDPLERADLIYVLSGMRLERVVEAGDLYREGWAPRILLSRQLLDGGEIALKRRGVAVPDEVDVQRTALVAMGVPPEAIEATGGEQVATATESTELRRLSDARGWTRIIVVTSKLHTGRARLAFARRFEGSRARIIMRASRHDGSDIDRWWASRADARFALIEAQKMLLYWVGLAD